MSDSNLKMLLDIIGQSFNRQSWHGTNLRESVRRVTHRMALWRPSAERHKIWEIVLHTAYWKRTAR